MEQKHKSISLADQIFEKLEHDILSGKYERGEILTESNLSLELGVSRTPIREALRRLSQEHIIDETTKGSVVLGITKDDVKDIFKIRRFLEGLAAAQAAQIITDSQLEELKEALELQEFYADKNSSDNVADFDSKFHEMIYRFSGSTVFYDTLVPLHRKAQKYRRISITNHGRAANSVKEHRAIYEALAAHDSESAEKLAALHVSNAASYILNGGN